LIDLQYIKQKPKDCLAAFYWHIFCNMKIGELPPSLQEFSVQIFESLNRERGQGREVFLSFLLSFMQESPIEYDIISMEIK